MRNEATKNLKQSEMLLKLLNKELLLILMLSHSGIMLHRSTNLRQQLALYKKLKW